MSQLTLETDRIKNEYKKRDSSQALAAAYSPSNPAGVYIRQQVEFYIADHLFRKFGGPGPSGAGVNRAVKDLRLLDIGTGSGSMLAMFAALGFEPSNLFGADLIFDRARAASEKSPASGIVNCNAAFMPFKDSSFDVVSQFTVFSSVTSVEMKSMIASEMRRVVKPGGTIIWYDMIHTNPFNANLKGVGYGEITELFGARPRECSRIVLNPWILRPLLGYSKALCDMLSALKILNSFYICFIKVKK